MIQKGAIEPVQTGSSGFYSSPKSFGIMETSHRLVNTEPIHQLPIIQDGCTPVCYKLPLERSMANIPGIAGCIFPHSDKPQEQTLSPVLPGYKCIPISSPPFWSLHKPKSLHQGTETGTGIRSCTWPSTSHVSGRLAPQSQLVSGISCQTLWLIRVCTRLGWIVNVEKSQLIPTQTLVYFGIQINLPDGESLARRDKDYQMVGSGPAPAPSSFRSDKDQTSSVALKSHWKQESGLSVAQVPLDLKSNQSLVW